MTNEAHRIGIIGGTGFVGRVLCRQLLAQGHALRVLTRRAAPHADLEELGGLRLVEGDPGDQHFLASALADCDVAINLAGILNEHGKAGRDFKRIHVDLPRTLGRACRQAGVERVLHMSALGASAGSAPSRYLRSKGEGGNALQVELGGSIPWTIFRPSVIFGPGDSLTNRFAGLLRLSPWVFPLACPDARFAPVYVEDVAAAFAASIDHEPSQRARYALCGPREYSLRELVALVARISGRPRRILPLSDRVSRLQAAVMERVPGKPFSRDNYLSLQVDSVCGQDSIDRDGFAALGITAAALEELAPGWLAPQAASGQDRS